MKFDISKKLIGGFLIVVTLLIIISIVSFLSLNAVENNADSIKFSANYDEAIMSLIITVYQQQDAITDYSLTHEEEVLAEIEAFSKRFKDQVRVLKTFAKTEAERKAVENLINAHADFEALGAQMSKAFVSGNMEEGLDLMEKFDSAASWQEKMMAKVKKVAMTIGYMSQKQAKASASRARTVLVLISLVAIVIGFGVAFFIARSISGPVKTLAEATKKIAHGDLTHTVNISNRDEIGEMAELFNDMSHNFRKVIRSIQETSLEISAVSEKSFATAEGLGSGTEMQESSIESTSSSIEEMNVSVKEIAKSTADLTSRSSGASSSIIEIVASIGDVAEIAEDLSSIVDESSSAISEMAASLAEITSHVSQLSEYTSETVSSVTQINKSIEETENSVKTSIKISEGNVRDAEVGREAVENTIQSMEKIQDTVQTTAKVIKALGEKSVSIGNILNVINSITEQTNLLALNAAIIAAQAGEEGRGFAIVADQIKALANKTKNYTKEIEGIVTPVQLDVENAVNLMEEGAINVSDGVARSKMAGEALDKILSSAQSSVDIHEKIKAAASEQLMGSQHASEAMEKIMTMLTKIYRAIEDQEKGSKYVAKASEKMNESARQVKDATKKQSYAGEHIQAAIEEMNNVIKNIDRATQEQATGSNQLLCAVAETKIITTENILSVKEMKDMAGTLVNQVEVLENIVNKFKVA